MLLLSVSFRIVSKSSNRLVGRKVNLLLLRSRLSRLLSKPLKAELFMGFPGMKRLTKNTQFASTLFWVFFGNSYSCVKCKNLKYNFSEWVGTISHILGIQNLGTKWRDFLSLSVFKKYICDWNSLVFHTFLFKSSFGYWKFFHHMPIFGCLRHKEWFPLCKCKFGCVILVFCPKHMKTKDLFWFFLK